jgi:hypothetical protein
MRKVASGVLRVDSNPFPLRTLSADCPEVEIGRQEFTRIRLHHHIKVKTFQEAFGLFGANVGLLNSKVWLSPSLPRRVGEVVLAGSVFAVRCYITVEFCINFAFR